MQDEVTKPNLADKIDMLTGAEESSPVASGLLSTPGVVWERGLQGVRVRVRG
jgi:hypothetical protein